MPAFAGMTKKHTIPQLNNIFFGLWDISANKMKTAKQKRDFAIDWLRVFAMGMVFLFHCARYFDNQGWHVKNPQTDVVITFFVLFLSQWIMPLFFILSGISTYYMLSFRKTGQFIKSRFTRLLIPFIFGTFVLIPPQVYIERVSNNQFIGSFFEFYPHYFDGFYAFGGNFAWMGLHLWYLEMLFVFSLLFLPLFLFLRKEKTWNSISNLSKFFKPQGTIFLPALPLALLEFMLDPGGIGRRDFGGWSLFLYMIFFIYGYVIFTHHKFKPIIDRNGNLALFGGIMATTLAIVLLLMKGFPPYGNSPYFLFMTTLRAFNSWFWLIAIFSFGEKYFTAQNGFLGYANEAVLPFYILHQTVIVIIGFYFINWNTGVYFKYLVLCVASFVSICIIYDVLVRRINILRFLFGLKWR
jgi:peptidoglycan/LPS O-acetylase OafA/YrhL